MNNFFKIYTLFFTALLFLCLTIPGWAAAGTKSCNSGPDYIKKELLVKFNNKVSEHQIAVINKRLGTKVKKSMGDVLVLQITNDRDVKSLVQEYNALPEVEYAEPNSVYTIQ